MTTSSRRRSALGLICAGATAVVVGAVAGGSAGAAALMFGLLALGIQLLAARLAAGRPPTAQYGIGLALRVAGVALIWCAVVIDRAAFPPGAAAVGYLGTLLPLLWLETRLT